MSSCPFCKVRKEPCDFCERHGLPILPLRYAVARSESVVPNVAEPMGAGLKDIPLPDNTAHYTTRLLRTGYLYVYNENRNTWQAFVVTGEGYLSEFDIHSKAPPDVGGQKFSCSRDAHGYIARCVMIPDAADAGNVWFGFSDVAWTPDVLEEHKKKDYRKKHMRCVNVADWLAGTQLSHTAAFNEVGERVAEYTISQYPYPQAQLPFDFSPFEFNFLEEEVSGITAWADQACDKHQPMMLAVEDPAGIAIELAQLMRARTDSFIYDAKKHPDRHIKVATSGAITQLRAAIKNQAEMNKVADYNKELEAHKNWVPSRRYSERPEPPPPLTGDELDQIGENAWDNYYNAESPDEPAYYDEPARATFQTEYEEALGNFEQDILTPLAEAHVAWMKSTALANQLICNTDPDDIWSGLGYVQVMVMCIDTTVDKPQCAALYRDWLTANDPTDATNLLLRALVLNQKSLATKVAEAAGNSFGPDGGIDWDSLIDLYQTTTEPFAKDHTVWMGKLVLQLGGPLAQAANNVLNHDGDGRAALVALGMIQQSPVVRLTLSGTEEDFRALVTRAILRSQGDQAKDLRQAVELELLRMKINGANLTGKTERSWLIAVDSKDIKGMPDDLPSQQAKIKWVQQSIFTATQLNKAVTPMWLDRLGGQIASDVGAGIVGALLQVWNLMYMVDAESMAHERKESYSRLVAGVAGVAATVGITAGKTLEELTIQVSSKARYAALRRAAKVFLRVGRTATAVAGLITAFWNIAHIWSAFSKGDWALAGLYSASTVVGIGIYFALAMSAWVIFGALIIMAVVIAVAISWFSDNDIQDWLEHCCWGTASKQDHYNTWDEAQEQLQIAIGA